MISLPTMLWLAYATGTIAILLEWRSYLLQCGRAFRSWSAVAALLWAVMYALLGAWTAALTMGTTAVRTWLSGWLDSHRYKHQAAFGFVLIFLIITVLSWQGPVSLLPAFAVINTTLALFYLGNRPMRIALLLSSIAWITNDFLWQAWPALLSEGVSFLLNLYTIRKMKEQNYPP